MRLSDHPPFSIQENVCFDSLEQNTHTYLFFNTKYLPCDLTYHFYSLCTIMFVNKICVNG